MSVRAPWLTEAVVDLITAQIKAQIATALGDVRTTRGDAAVVTELPKNYFISERAHGYQTPAVFVVAGDFDFKKGETQSNVIIGAQMVDVSIVIEDRDSTTLTRRAWRYQSALVQCLDQIQLVTADSRVKVEVLVMRVIPSPTFTREKSGNDNPFRKEIRLECEVVHWESGE